MKNYNFKTDNKPSKICKFREYWIKKSIELINITPLTEFRLGHSGNCNSFNEPEENIYHIQIHYRGEPIVNVGQDGMCVIDDDKYVIFGTERWKGDCSNDFIIFRKVRN